MNTDCAIQKTSPSEILGLPVCASQEQLEIAYHSKLRELESQKAEQKAFYLVDWAYREMSRYRLLENRKTDGVVSAELFPQFEPLFQNAAQNPEHEITHNVIEMNRRTGASASRAQEELDELTRIGLEIGSERARAERHSELDVLLEMPEISESSLKNSEDEEDILEQIVSSQSFADIFQPRRRRSLIGEGEKEVVGIRTPNSYNPESQQKIENLVRTASAANGQLLVTLRSTLGVTTEEIAIRTKINLRHLIALENDDYANMPASVYFRGFVDSYLKYLGIKHQGLVNAYIESYQKARYFLKG